MAHYYDCFKNSDKFNYEIMHDLLHELTHVYQKTRTETSDNIFDKLVFLDKEANYENHGWN